LSLASFDASWRAVLACEVPSCRETSGLSHEVLYRPGKAGETFRLCRKHKAEAEKEGLLRRSSLVTIRTHKEIQPMPPAPCLVPGCTNKITGRGLCATHYARANAARMFTTNKERPPFTAEELAQLAATPVQPRAVATARPSAVAVGQRQGTASGAKEGAEQIAPSAPRYKLAERLGLPPTTTLDTVLQSAISTLATQEHMITEARQRLDELTAREGHLRRELEQVAAGAVEPVAPTIGHAGSLQRQLAERLGLPPTTMSETVSKAGLEALEALTAKIAQLTGQADDDVRVCAGALSQIAAALGVESGDPEAIEAAALALSQKLAEAEAANDATVAQRDRAEAFCDQLAARIAAGRDIGEHSNGNNPWRRALDLDGEIPKTPGPIQWQIAQMLGVQDYTIGGLRNAVEALVGGLDVLTRRVRYGDQGGGASPTDTAPALAGLSSAFGAWHEGKDRAASALCRIAATLGVESGDPEAIEAAAATTRQKFVEAEARAAQIAARVAASGGDAGADAAARMRAYGRIAGYLDCDDSLQAIEAAAKGLTGGLMHMTHCYRVGERRYVNEGIQAVPALNELVAAIDGYRDRCVESARRAAAEALAPQVQATPPIPWERLDQFLRSHLVLRVYRADDVFHFETQGAMSSVSTAKLALNHERLAEGLMDFLTAGIAVYGPLGER